MEGFRVLHTNMHKGGWGGQPNRILIVARGLQERGHHVVIAAPRGATLIARAQEEGIPVFDDLVLPKRFRPFTYISEVLKFCRLIKAHRINVVHTHGSQDTWAAVVAAWLVVPRPLVVRTRHNIFPVRNHLFNRLLYRRLTDGVIVVSDAVTEVFSQTGVLGDKIGEVLTLHSVVDAKEKFNPAKVDAAGLREELGIPPFAPVVVKVARLAPEKGHLYFLESAKAVLKEVPDAYFLALGEGPLRGSLEKRVREMGIQNRVKFLGLRRDVPRVLKISQVFSFTPVAGESLGTAALEALAMEVPVVAFNVGGIEASVRHGKTGFLVEPKDVEGLARYTVKLLKDKSLRCRMGKAGRRWMLKAFSEEGLVEGNIAFYRRLTKRLSLSGEGS